MIRPRVPTCYATAWCQQLRHARLAAWTSFAALLVWTFLWRGPTSPLPRPPQDIARPLIQTYIENGRGQGGRWYLPDDWLNFEDRSLQPYSDIERYMDIRNPRSPAEAAQMALELCMRRNLYLANTKIPLIVHQTWKDTKAASWGPDIKDGVEAWLGIATGDAYPDSPKMAYILWDDSAVDALIELYEKELWDLFQQLPQPVEKADIFRIAVVKWFGGLYADIDTDPLQHPAHWIQTPDLAVWNDSATGHQYYLYDPVVKSYQPPDGAPYRPHVEPDSPSDTSPASYTNTMKQFAPQTVDVGAIFGLEADAPANTDRYWRAGYSYPAQLTNWALAAAPHHPIAAKFIAQVVQDIRSNLSRIEHCDPLELTGPPALTRTVKSWSEGENPSFRWESVSGLQDPKGGRGKVVAGDIMILPITGFSPGRGKYNNMGSEPIDHPNARLKHNAQGSWRHTNVRVQAGKICRTLLGMCRDWPKTP